MSLDRDLIDAVRDLTKPELRRLLMLTTARLGEDFVASSPKIRMREQWVRCGKDSCTSCPHGPYWYAYWTENGRRRSRYIGKLIDGDIPGEESAELSDLDTE